jgi:hypothetical protein
MIGFRSEVAEAAVTGSLGFFNGFPELDAVEAVKAVALNDARFNVLAQEYIFKRAFDGSGTGSGGTGDSDDRVLA